MRIVIFTSSHHLLANYIVKELFKVKNVEIVGIVESAVVYPGKGKLEALFFMIKKSGIRYVSSQVIKFLFFQFGSLLYNLLPTRRTDHFLYSYHHHIAKKQNVPIFLEKNINTPQFYEKIKKMKPDLFVSIFFNQIFKRDVLFIPRKGTINLHPAFLPSYRGLSPTFWVLANGEISTGITVHRIDDEAIDAGKILGQVSVSITRDDTEYSLYWRCVRKGLPMLKSVIKSLARNRKNWPDARKGITPSYFTLPTKADVARFKARGRGFLTIRQLLFSAELK